VPGQTGGLPGGQSIPSEQWIALEVVKNGFDAADDWIVAHAGCHDIVITKENREVLKERAYVLLKWQRFQKGGELSEIEANCSRMLWF